MRIKFSDDFQDVNAFTTGIQFFKGDIILSQGRSRVNGRSFLGICSLDLNKPIDITIETDNEGVRKDLYNYLKKWEVID